MTDDGPITLDMIEHMAIPTDQVAAMHVIRRLTTPKLEEFRASLPKMPTSQLITLVAHLDALLTVFEDDTLHDDLVKLLVGAGVVAVSDEIDRRIPVPA